MCHNMRQEMNDLGERQEILRGMVEDKIRMQSRATEKYYEQPETTVVSGDRISACDVVSRRAMLAPDGARWSRGIAVCSHVLHFAAPASVGGPGGVVHTIDQADGGEQGDPLMPLLFSLGQHGLEAVQRSPRDDERILAFTDDIYIITSPARVGAVVACLQEQLCIHARIRSHGARRKSGMVPGSGLRRAMPSSGLSVWWTLEPWCGRDHSCLSRIRASRCWEHHWVTPSSSPHTWSRSRKSTGCCWNESQQFRMCNLHG